MALEGHSVVDSFLKLLFSGQFAIALILVESTAIVALWLELREARKSDRESYTKLLESNIDTLNILADNLEDKEKR